MITTQAPQSLQGGLGVGVTRVRLDADDRGPGEAAGQQVRALAQGPARFDDLSGPQVRHRREYEQGLADSDASFDRVHVADEALEFDDELAGSSQGVVDGEAHGGAVSAGNAVGRNLSVAAGKSSRAAATGSPMVGA
ncbi:MAG: hypothetical protein ACYTGE_14425 [Planctomycetota bacterium]|jgi:hypothetical protein